MDTGDRPRPHPRGAFLGLLLTGVGLTFCILVLIFISGGFFLYVVLITAAIFAVSLLHYVVWGRALSQSMAGEREEEILRRRAAEGPDDDGPPPDRQGIRRP
jgi:hypothetical protein